MDTTMETPDPLGYQVFHMSKLSEVSMKQNKRMRMLEVPHFNTKKSRGSWMGVPPTKNHFWLTQRISSALTI
jgi:hypothetical protein